MNERDSLREVVRKVLGETWPPLPGYASALPADPAGLLETAGELGWFELEGEGGGYGYTAAVLEELGAALGPGELATRLSFGPLLGARWNGRPLAASWAAPSWRREDGAPVFDGTRVSGEVTWVLGSGPLLLAADHGGRPVVLLVAGGPGSEPVAASDPTRDFRRWTGRDVPAEVVAEGAGATALTAALAERVDLGLALDALGTARAALELTLAYARIREQFGVPIGSFQAVKHRCVDMFVRVQCAEALVESALDGGGPYLPAKTAACAAAAAVTRDALQTHGGVGYTWEHPCHLLLRRAKLDQALGTPASRARRAAGALLVADLTTHLTTNLATIKEGDVDARL